MHFRNVMNSCELLKIAKFRKELTVSNVQVFAKLNNNMLQKNVRSDRKNSYYGIEAFVLSNLRS